MIMGGRGLTASIVVGVPFVILDGRGLNGGIICDHHHGRVGSIGARIVVEVYHL